MPSITTFPSKKSKSEKISVTLRIPAELKSWADDFANRSHLDLSGLFILSLAETQRRGELHIVPKGYEDVHLSETPITTEKLDELRKIISDYDTLEGAGETKKYQSSKDLHDAIVK